MRIIACDFDGTLCENRFPEIGEPKLHVIEHLKYEQNNGAKIILWTCREGEFLTRAIEWCKQNGLTFDAVNDNVAESVRMMNCNSRKVFAHEYWDDRSIACPKQS